MAVNTISCGKRGGRTKDRELNGNRVAQKVGRNEFGGDAYPAEKKFETRPFPPP